MQLRDFYRAYRKWAADGAPVENVHGFHRGVGLCTNLANWVDSLRGYPAEHRWAETRRLKKAMLAQFEAAGHETAHPFGYDAYQEAQRKCIQHLDQNRLAWVREHC